MDLQLLRPLYALLEERHVSRAAERCAVSQPAMSRILQRLRVALDDELLVRAGKRYERTPRGESLLVETRSLLDRFDAIVTGRSFEPSRCDATFRVATTDYASAVFIPALLHELQKKAPLAALSLHLANDEVFADITAGRLDAAIISTGEGLEPSHLSFEPLFEDRYVCVVGPQLRVPKRGFDLDSYMRQRHVAIDVAHGIQPAVDRPLSTYGLRRSVAYRTPFLTAALFAVAATALVLTVPRRLAIAVPTGLGLRIVPAPAELEAFRYMLFWHGRIETSVAHKWFLERLIAVAKQ
jgi:DNA-binding transcriptional LysR family regulator